ncbi:DNA translocase FtsK [Halobacillus seohaensis]|uniref:DNA translocase FtsK n=1 Tax=Halobacillus seohaensis TaxID=447421 RepID=A0ABW2EGN3_9BACI
MWKNFKDKFKNFFDGNEEPSQFEQQPIKPTSNNYERELKDSNASTKMTYKYPKQGNFRFPIIPDRSIQQEEPEPVSQDRTNRVDREKTKRADNNGEKPERNHRKDRTTSNDTEQEESEASDIPFTPSDVPSPVYGYHPRSTPVTNYEKLPDSNKSTTTARMEQSRHDEEHWQSIRQRVLGKIQSKKTEEEYLQVESPGTEISADTEVRTEETLSEDVPSPNVMSYSETANEEILENTEEMIEGVTEERIESTEEMVESVTDESTGSTEEMVESVTDESTGSTEEMIESVTDESTGSTEEILEENTDELAVEGVNESDSGVNQEHTSGVPKLETEENHPSSENENERTSERKSVPFNVVMTPRDKRTRDQQKKTLHKQEKKSEVTFNNNVQRESYSTPLNLLNDKVRKSSDDEKWIHEQMDLLETTLRQFHVKAKVVHAMKGPAVTRFEVQPEPGVKVSKITNLSDDIKLSMAARDIRIEAPIPGKQAVGIEVPNKQPEMVGLQEIFESEAFKKDSSPLSVALGLDIGGDPVVTNLKKMPHGLIAGATGSGKSVCINTILISMLYKAHHEDVKFLLIDPKMVELAPYNGLPHLVSPVITDVKAATIALKWAVKEMEERYEKFVAEGARDVERYNEKMIQQGRRAEKLPYLVIVIDELADLMMVSPQDVEDAICRIAQKARACGIHLLVATQRPSVDVITGLIKANIPTRMAFSVSSQVDSRTIIDTGGAEKLLGKGDMLFIENGSGQSVRIQGSFVSDEEIERVTAYVRKQAPTNYLFEQDELIQQISTEEDTDAIFDDAVQFVLEQNGASASLLQRKFKVGYNRAARLIDQMADYGIISEAKGSKPRDVLLTKQQIDEMLVR